MARFGRVPGLLDESSQPVYDTLAIVAGTAAYRFFQVPVGAAKTYLSTNMTQPGMLPPPQSMVVMAVRIIVKAATTAICDAILNNSRVEFKIGEKLQLQAPTLLFSAGAGTYNNITLDRAQNGVPDARSIWALQKPCVIGVQQNFYLDLIYDAPPATAAAGVSVLAVLDGYLTRGVQ